MDKENYNYLRIKKLDWEQYCEYLDKIKTHINSNEPIPKKLFAEYESLIIPYRTNNLKYYRPKQEVIHKNITEYFKKYPAYHFTTNNQGINQEYMDFNDMIWSITFMLTIKLSLNSNTYKDNILKNKLNYIIDFASGYSKGCGKIYNQRQLCIIAGRIIIEYGYSLIGNKPLTNSNLFYAVRNAIKYKSKKAQDNS